MTNKTVSIIVGPDCDLEAIALRGFLEYIGFIVLLRPIGRPNDLISILKGDQQTNISGFLVFCFHGKEGKFIMPEISKEIYETAEPRKRFDANHISEFAKLNGQNVIVTGCTLGHKKMADSFLKSGARTFIGAREYPDGNSAFMFATSLFYYLMQGEKYPDAFLRAKNTDDETSNFELHETPAVT